MSECRLDGAGAFYAFFGGRFLPTLMESRRPHLLALPLSHLDASGTLRSVFIDGCFMAVSSSVEKFAMWW